MGRNIVQDMPFFEPDLIFLERIQCRRYNAPKLTLHTQKGHIFRTKYFKLNFQPQLLMEHIKTD